MKLGANKTDAKDIVSQMYLRILNKLNNGLNIDYEDSFNNMYIINTLRSLFIDQKRKDKGEILTLRIDGNGDVVVMNREGMFLNAKPVKLRSPQYYDFHKLHKELERRLDIIQKQKSVFY